ncbi:MAG: hypothetical protein C0624_07760 [Desulfuromonas sp.]|nr:MAG: hypothetical protein C0624_07760 [Desulfuromonas sp.]
MSEPFTLELVQGVALLTLDVPEASVNVLSTPIMRQLDKLIEQLEGMSGLTAVAIHSAKKSGFVAGADISEIEGVEDPEIGADLARNGQRIFTRLERLKVPVVAALHGHCMGGGTELALACHYRIAADNLTMALPETRLGILPGFGGTQRLPRLIPLNQALDMILSGRTYRAPKALSCGLIDQRVPMDKLKDAAIDLARQVAANPSQVLSKRRARSGGLLNALAKTPLGCKLVISMARKQLLRTTGGNYPAPLKALKVIGQTLGLSLDRGLDIEAQALGELIVSRESKNLIHIYHLTQRHRKSLRLGEVHLPKQAAILGAGVMGSGIAQLIAEKGIPVILRDLNSDVVEKGLAHIRAALTPKYLKRGLGQDAVDKVMGRITGTTSLDNFQAVELVIEAVVENLEIKKKVLQEIEPHLNDKAIFATNTSALSVSAMQQVGNRPSIVGGLHFFNPVSRMPLVEIIRGKETTRETLDSLLAFADKLGKTPITVADRPGFLVNRLLMVYLNEAGLLAEEGFDWLDLDHQIKKFGLPMGPFRLIDEVGIDVAAEVGTTLCNAFSYLPESRLMKEASSSGLLGKKGKKGFYTYPKQGKPAPNPAIDSTLNLSRSSKPDTEQLHRMLYLMVNEAARCLEEEVVDSPYDVDTGMVFVIGFPPFQGGLCRWADNVGNEIIAKELDQLAEQYGERFIPQGVIARKKTFYT